MAFWDTWAKVAPILTPLVVAVVGFFITHSITRIQVGPEFIDLAMEIIEQDPLTQPEGVRIWAVDLINKYSGVPLEEDLAQRIVAGWSFAPAEWVGRFFFDFNETHSFRLDEKDLELRALVSGEAGQRLTGFELLQPEDGSLLAKLDLQTTHILRFHLGWSTYLLVFEGLQPGSLARFSVWKQPPSPRRRAGFEPPPRPGWGPLIP